MTTSEFLPHLTPSYIILFYFKQTDTFWHLAYVSLDLIQMTTSRPQKYPKKDHGSRKDIFQLKIQPIWTLLGPVWGGTPQMSSKTMISERIIQALNLRPCGPQALNSIGKCGHLYP